MLNLEKIADRTGLDRFGQSRVRSYRLSEVEKASFAGDTFSIVVGEQVLF